MKKKANNPAYNYFKKNKRNEVQYGAIKFVCANANQADLLRKWIKAGDKFEIK